jgi:hypothetical protein
VIQFKPLDQDLTDEMRWEGELTMGVRVPVVGGEFAHWRRSPAMF